MFTLHEIQFLFDVLLKYREDHDMDYDQSETFQSVMEQLSNYSVRKMAMDMKFNTDGPDHDLPESENVISLVNYLNKTRK